MYNKKLRGGLLNILRGTIIENLQKRTENFKMYIIILWFSAFFVRQRYSRLAPFSCCRQISRKITLRHATLMLVLGLCTGTFVFKKALLWLSYVTYIAPVLFRYPVQYYFVYCVCVVQLHFCNISCYNH